MKFKILSDITKVINELKERHNIVCSMFHGIDYKNWSKLSSKELSKLTVKKSIGILNMK
ncbi:hypothetical protein [Anaerocellum danielii]|uniref:Uncharacterized protein n=1 Tax=Anaerocellum danielii TaxID=1387557 RepID=A0ABZ0TZB6_9FIRM|nr:hypothetical protein [Caldicellulosiruptor danielii]WPX07738.1 hypothetical protein SOJ16_001566 [Caldicellulosiruptor danielii]